MAQMSSLGTAGYQDIPDPMVQSMRHAQKLKQFQEELKIKKMNAKTAEESNRIGRMNSKIKQMDAIREYISDISSRIQDPEVRRKMINRVLKTFLASSEDAADVTNTMKEYENFTKDMSSTYSKQPELPKGFVRLPDGRIVRKPTSTQDIDIGRTRSLLNALRGDAPVGTTANVDLGGGVKANIPVNREYTAGEAQTLTQAETMISQAQSLKNLLTGENKATALQRWSSLVPEPFRYGTTAEKIGFLRKDFSDQLLRLRSGAQVSEPEYKRFLALMPNPAFETEETIKMKLDKFIKQFSAIRDRIKSGARYDETSNSFYLPNGEKWDSQESTETESSSAEDILDKHGVTIDTY